MKELKDVQEKYDLFLIIYEQGVKEYIPFYKVKEKGKKKKWFNGKYARAKKRRENRSRKEKKNINQKGMNM